MIELSLTCVMYISVILIGLVCKKSKLVSVYILSAMYFLAAFNYSNADYYSYTLSYQQSALAHFEYRYIGYSLLIHSFASRGITYSQYLKVIFLILFILLYVAIRLLTDKPNVVLALFAIFPFAMDVVQVKAFYSEVIALLAIVILIRILSDNNNRHLFIKICFVLILGVLSVSFHFSGVYYLIVGVLFYLIKDRRKLGSKVFVVSVATFVLIYTGSLAIIMRMASKIGLISNMDYLSRYFQRSTRWGFIVSFAGVFLMMVACSLSDQSLEWTEKTDILSKRQDLLRAFIMTVSMVLPFLMITVTFDRLIRIYMILLYIYFVNLPKTIEVNLKKTLSYVAFVLSLVFYFVTDTYYGLDETLFSILNYSELYTLL